MRPWPGGLPPSDGAVPWEERHLLPEPFRKGFDPYEYIEPRSIRVDQRVLWDRSTYDTDDLEIADKTPSAEEILIAIEDFREGFLGLREHTEMAERSIQRRLEENKAREITEIRNRVALELWDPTTQMSRSKRSVYLGAVMARIRYVFRRRHTLYIDEALGAPVLLWLRSMIDLHRSHTPYCANTPT